MRTYLFGGQHTGITTASARFMHPMGAGETVSSTDQIRNNFLMPCSGTLTRLRGTIGGAPGAGITRTVSVYVNGVESALSDAMTGASDQDYEDFGSVSVVAGDIITIGTYATAVTVATAPWIWSIEVETVGGGQTVVSGSAVSQTAAVWYIVPSGQKAGLSIPRHSMYAPHAATLRNLYVNCAVAPGVGSSRIFTLHKNGVATAVTCTVTALATTASDVANSVSVVAGDLLTIHSDFTVAPATSDIAVGLQWDSVEFHEQPVMTATTTAPSTTVTHYGYVNSGGTVTPSTAQRLTQPCGQANNLAHNVWIKYWAAYVTTAPGAGKSYTVSPDAGSSPSVVIADANTSASTTTRYDGVPITYGTQEWVPSGTPTTPGVTYTSAVMYTASFFGVTGTLRVVGAGLSGRCP